MDGRLPTVNKLKGHLAGGFESAKQEGILEQNPYSSTNDLKVEAIEKGTFTSARLPR